MSLARVQFFSISLDGFGTGEGQSLEAPLDTPANGCKATSSPLGVTRVTFTRAAHPSGVHEGLTVFSWPRTSGWRTRRCSGPAGSC